MDPKDSITRLISKGNVEEALALWLQSPGVSNTLRTDLLGYSARLATIAEVRNQGRIDSREELRERSAVLAAMLDSLKNWQPGGNSGPLDQAIRGLGISADTDIAPVHLVNCDRAGQAYSFRRAFNQRQGKNDFQFYFICGCPTEMPSSFGKRLIYEIGRDRLDDRLDALSFPFQEDADRIKVENLPIASDLPGSQKRLKEYVAKRFHFSDTQSFEAFIETGVPKLPYDYVTAVFEISEKKWDNDEGEIQEYFEWMIETFRCPNKNVPTFLFFIVVKGLGLWENPAGKTDRQKTILAQLDAIRQKYPEQATVLSDFPPVDEQDFDDWVADIDGIRNPNQSRAVTRALAATFEKDSEEDNLYRKQKKFHVKDIEPVQRRIYDIATN
ncbi:MAG: hypothetical protein IPM98_16470 [Lewinellaceae bacterium]|nr:hypothetical protein [Lewinellaceae bacterium]